MSSPPREKRKYHRKKKGKPGKLRAREFRERRKEYIKELEDKVDFLEDEVKRLTEENSLLKGHPPKSISGASTMEERKLPCTKSDLLRQEEEYFYSKIPDMIKEGQDKVSFSMIEQ